MITPKYPYTNLRNQQPQRYGFIHLIIFLVFVLGVATVVVSSISLGIIAKVSKVQGGGTSPLKTPSIVSAVTATGSQFHVPMHAAEVSPNSYFMGVKKHPNGRMVNSYAIVHIDSNITRSKRDTYAEGNYKRQIMDQVTCSSAIADGFRWRSTAQVLFDPQNNEGISQSTLNNLYRKCRTKWNSVSSFLIIGSVTVTDLTGVDFNYPDGINEVAFAYISNTFGSNVIAITIIYGTDTGPTNSREIVEVDQLFNTAYMFGNALSNPGDIDTESVMTHELGHFCGLADIYNTSCATYTVMYGYLAAGQTDKRTLKSPEIQIIADLYGAGNSSLLVTDPTSDPIINDPAYGIAGADKLSGWYACLVLLLLVNIF